MDLWSYRTINDDLEINVIKLTLTKLMIGNFRKKNQSDKRIDVTLYNFIRLEMTIADYMSYYMAPKDS